MPSTTHARCSGTFGELVQGKLASRCFLVTLPIDIYSQASFSPTGGDATRLPHGYEKVGRFVKALEVELGVQVRGQLQIESAIPRGKGLASSSSDLVAAGTAILSAYGIPATSQPALISRATRRVEPTDGVMHAGIVSYDQHHSRLIEHFGAIDLAIVGCILPGQVDTCSYDSSKIAYSNAEEAMLKTAYLLARRGVREADCAFLGMAASISAEINQSYLPKPKFAAVKRLCRLLGAAGIVVAHSGTAIGLLAPKDASSAQLATMADGLSQLYGHKASRFYTHNDGPYTFSRERQAVVT